MFADAGHWAHTSYELNLAKQALYAQLHQKMVALLGQGAANAANVSNALSTSANTYEAEDLAGAQRFTN